MQGVSPHLWECVAQSADDDARAGRCVDAWSTAIRIITTGNVADVQGRRLELAGGGAIFESAGPDRDFGDDSPVRQMDNMSSDDPSVALGE
jgi:hypothetical protein